MPSYNSHNKIVSEVLEQTDGELLSIVLESKIDGSIFNIVGRNHFTHSTPHFVSDGNVVFPLSKFFIQEFN